MLIGLFAAAAVAASPPPGGVLPNEQAAYDAMLVAQAREADKAFAGSICADAKVEVVSITPVKIGDRPDLIAWRERVRVTGCGRTSIENLSIGRLGANPPWRMTHGLPGDSLADIQLQGSTAPAAAALARTDLPAGCQGQKLRDVYIGARPGGVDVSPPGVAPKTSAGRIGISLPAGAAPMLDKLDLPSAWMEVWPFEICGQNRTLGVVFIPLKDRTTSHSFFIPVWRQTDAKGSAAAPNPATPK